MGRRSRFVQTLFTAAAVFTWFAADAGAGNSRGLGETLFTREWQPNDPLSLGDGLGPVFNAKSCVACHHQGGVGGGGPERNNADLLSVSLARVENLPSTLPKAANRTLNGLSGIAERFAERRVNSFVLHRHSTRPTYAVWRDLVVPRQDRQAIARIHAASSHAANAIVLRITQRNTPSLFGAGLVDQVREDTLREITDLQARQTKGRITGVVAPRVGRFGWRGQTSTLREFVSGACANELGLETKTNSQPPLPIDQDYKNPNVDMTEDMIDAMVEFIADLPAPKRILPKNNFEKSAHRRGARLFKRLECATCHVPNVQHVHGIYSDLLLHDMGAELSDPVTVTSGTVSASYYGGGSSPSSSGLLAQQWRTPPLWGVRDTAPYLHDGRAATLLEAIQMHGGQAKVARKKFSRLRPKAQEELLVYVNSLGAP